MNDRCFAGGFGGAGAHTVPILTETDVTIELPGQGSWQVRARSVYIIDENAAKASGRKAGAGMEITGKPPGFDDALLGYLLRLGQRRDHSVMVGDIEGIRVIRDAGYRVIPLESPEDAANLVGEASGEGKGFYLQMAGFAAGRLQTGGRASGVAQAALEATATYAAERKQFGKAIGEFQLTQYKLGRMATHLAAARQLTYAAAGRSERGDQDLTFFGAAAKCFASDVAMEVTTNAVQVLGGYGFTRDYPVERMMRDAKITQIYEGTNQVQRIVMARQLLAGVQSQL